MIIIFIKLSAGCTQPRSTVRHVGQFYDVQNLFGIECRVQNFKSCVHVNMGCLLDWLCIIICILNIIIHHALQVCLGSQN